MLVKNRGKRAFFQCVCSMEPQTEATRGSSWRNRLRITRGKSEKAYQKIEETHGSHFSDKGFVGSFHDSSVHEPIPIQEM